MRSSLRTDPTRRRVDTLKTMVIDPELLLTAAITALFTTLVVEYLAKPWLDARKERIVEAHRERREVQRGLTRLAMGMGIISEGNDVWEIAPDRFAEEIVRCRSIVADIQAALPLLHNWRIPRNILSWFARHIGQLDGSLLTLSALVDKDLTIEQRHEAIRTVGTHYELFLPAADYVILKGRTHRQSFERNCVRPEPVRWPPFGAGRA